MDDEGNPALSPPEHTDLRCGKKFEAPCELLPLHVRIEIHP
jgi:hypothetical protein